MAATVASNFSHGDHGFAQSHDAAVDEFRQDLGFDSNGPAEQSFPQYDANSAPAKDVDEEVQIKKKRKPVPKLDEARLLSAHGIPRLRKIAKSSKVKFKGKGHEFSDMANLLSTYQFWLDDLYPKAKFRDALIMVEKLGHSRRMQVTRRAWIDETKPRGREPTPERVEDEPPVGAQESNETAQSIGADKDALMGNSGAAEDPDMPEDDDLDALLAEQDDVRAPPRRRTGPFDDDDDDDDGGPDADELDALMAEQDQPKPAPLQAPSAIRRLPFDEDDEEDPDQDELDALLAEQDQMNPTASTVTQTEKSAAQSGEQDGPDEDELDALMAERDQTTPRPDPIQATLNSSQPISVGEDELDALMDEQDALHG